MENQTPQSIQNPPTVPPQEKQFEKPKKQGIGLLKIIVFILFELIIIAGTFLAGSRVDINKLLKIDNKEEEIVPTSPPTSNIEPEEDEWVTEKSGLYSYEYPKGWHVAELWGSSEDGGTSTTIAINPKPINTAPRGGPIALFWIAITNGNNNPDNLLESKMALFNEEVYSDITKETINAPIGTVYYFKGKIKGEMLQGKPVETYYFTFNKNLDDPLNQQVVEASMDFIEDQKYSDMLRHIILSFKKLL